MNKDALMKLEQKFDQPLLVVRAYLDKLNNTPPVRMNNSDIITSLASMLSSIVGVFQSLSYTGDLERTTLLDKAIENLQPNTKKSWSLHIVKRNMHAPSLLDFIDWLEDIAKADERLRLSRKPEDNS